MLYSFADELIKIATPIIKDNGIARISIPKNINLGYQKCVTASDKPNVVKLDGKFWVSTRPIRTGERLKTSFNSS